MRGTSVKKWINHNNSNEPHLKLTSLISFVQGSIYTYGCLHMKQVKWAALCHHPYHMFKDCPYHDILCMMYADVKILSANTVSHDVKDIYNIVKKYITKLLQVWYLSFLCYNSFSLSQHLEYMRLHSHCTEWLGGIWEIVSTWASSCPGHWWKFSGLDLGHDWVSFSC